MALTESISPYVFSILHVMCSDVSITLLK